MKFPRRFQRYTLEFLTVFLGVSLSLLAENWRQNRSDTRAEHDSMIRLYGDMQLEEQDMTGNAQRAELGLRAARWLVANGARGHAADSVSSALTGIGVCSFFIPYTSEYTALKSSGRLSLIADTEIREGIVRFYEQESFLEWLHERDCILTGDLVDSLVGQLAFAEPGAPDRPRRNTRYPRIIFEPGKEALIEDATMRDRLVRLATQKQYLVDQIRGRVETSASLRKQIFEKLGEDTLTLQRRRRVRGGFTGDSLGRSGLPGDSFGRSVNGDSTRRPMQRDTARP